MSHVTNAQILKLIEKGQTELRVEMRAGFARTEERFVASDEKHAEIDQKFISMFEMFQNLQEQILDLKTELRSGLQNLGLRMDQLEVKTDQVYQTQLEDSKILSSFCANHEQRIVKLEKWRATV